MKGALSMMNPWCSQDTWYKQWHHFPSPKRLLLFFLLVFFMHSSKITSKNDNVWFQWLPSAFKRGFLWGDNSGCAGQAFQRCEMVKIRLFIWASVYRYCPGFISCNKLCWKQKFCDYKIFDIWSDLRESPPIYKRFFLIR